MNVRFGNLSVQSFADKVGVKFSDEDYKWMEERQIDKADFTDPKRFHIFNLPLGFLAGARVGKELIAILKKYEYKSCHFYVETKESGS